MKIDILCSGPHIGGVPVVGSIELPNDATDGEIASARNGVLCDDCGSVYVRGMQIPGNPPSVDMVCDILPTIRPANYQPRFPPGKPSWAKQGDPNWPPRKKPQNP